MSTPRHSLIRRIASRLDNFSRYAIGIPLRPYQQEVADAIVKSVVNRLGLSFVVIFPRQSGKNEAQAHIEAWLLCLLSAQDIEIVSVSPTYKPQALNAMLRLQRCLDRNPFTCGRWRSQSGFTVRLDKACVHFFSGNSVAHTVGATASALLSVDEAQDIRPSTYDRKFAPMVASTNATRVFWGTPWISSTLLAREKRRAESDQEKDGFRRLWTLTAEDVALVHPPYGEFVSSEVSRYGRTHPYIKTQYFSEEIDSQGSMFNPTRLALIFPSNFSPLNPQDLSRGEPRDLGSDSPSPFLSSEMGRAGVGLVGEVPNHSRGEVPNHSREVGSDSPSPFLSSEMGRDGVGFLLDVAGQDESRMDFGCDEAPLENPARDSASLSIVSIDLSTLPTLHAPTYRIVHRQQWTGCNHLTLFGQLKSLVESWDPQYIVMDATGVGEGLWALLDKTFPTRVIPVKFNKQVKSELGWKFLSIIDTGRFRDCARTATFAEHIVPEGYPRRGTGEPRPCQPHREASPQGDEGLTKGEYSDQVRLQYTACRSEALPSPAKSLRWGVPEGARGPDGQLIHDDFLLADSLVGTLDMLQWVIHTAPMIVPGVDPLERIDWWAPIEHYFL